MDLIGIIANMIETALMLPLMGVPIIYYILLNLIVGAVIGVLTRGE